MGGARRTRPGLVVLLWGDGGSRVTRSGLRHREGSPGGTDGPRRLPRTRATAAGERPGGATPSRWLMSDPGVNRRHVGRPGPTDSPSRISGRWPHQRPVGEAAAKSTTTFRCAACDAVSVKWTGRCVKCGEFGTIRTGPTGPAPGQRASATGRTPAKAAQPVSQIMSNGPVVRVTGASGSSTRVLGGGLVPGQVVLCSGPPGSGKSTLVLAVADSLAARTRTTVLYISARSLWPRSRFRAKRIGADSEYLLLADDTRPFNRHRPYRGPGRRVETGHHRLG